MAEAPTPILEMKNVGKTYSQNGRSISESFDQQGAQRPAPSPTGSRQEGQSCGSATSSASRNGSRKAAIARDKRDGLASCMSVSVTALGYCMIRESGSRVSGKFMPKNEASGEKNKVWGEKS